MNISANKYVFIIKRLQSETTTNLNSYILYINGCKKYMISTSHKEKTCFKTWHINVIHASHKQCIMYISKTFQVI